ERMLQTMSVSKLKVATMALVFALGIGLAALGWAAARPAPRSPSEKPAQIEPKRGTAEDATFAIRGRVVGKGTKPVAGARVRLFAQGFKGFDADVKTITDGAGRFTIAAPKSWTRMDSTQRQELALVVVEKDRLGILQFSRSSAPPSAEIELRLANV